MAVAQRHWKVGIAGTFDVENYGDLLFPLLAESELRARLGSVDVLPFSYSAKTAEEWPYAVTSVADLPRCLDELDGLLIGGGFLIRFDKRVADGYGPPSAAIHHPTGYWLTPALMALDRGLPVAWNAPGMHCNDIPVWAEPLLELAVEQSAYVSVRDVPSRKALSLFASRQRIHLVPDTAFGLAPLLPKRESAALQRVREQAGLHKPYIVVQPVRWEDDGFPAFLAQHREQLADYQLLALPMGPVLGDEAALLGDARADFVELPFWPDPLLLAELIANASAVVGYSYHLAITALAAGVPVFTSVDLDAGKFTTLREFESVHRLSSIGEGIEVFRSRLGKREPEPAVQATRTQLDEHWDRIAGCIRRGRSEVSPVFSRFWQSLPAFMEQRRGERVIDLQRIADGTLQTEPYHWATVDDLYSPADAAALAETFPTDHYKRVESYGGVKDYAYDARLLIGMGADTVAHHEHLSEAWQRLAATLLSPAYRNAVAALTGRDLSDAKLEVNVFHYGAGASLGAHPDLPDKLVTHVLYFNASWDPADGGCLTILRANDPAAVVAEIPPVVGNSAVLVRSDTSWHAVNPVVRDTHTSRRSLTATFYRPDAVSSMWPADDQTPLRDYAGERKRPWWRLW